jgi:ubiquinone biosynthesis protein
MPLKIARAVAAPIQILTAPFRPKEPRSARVSAALLQLGPSYVKLGQFLATRADVIGPDLVADLRHLQDKAPPFSMAEARDTIERTLGGRLEDHFVEFGPPVAAASIAQVHKAYVIENGVKKPVAVKILRPNIEKRFQRDLNSYYFAARLIERYYEPARRLKPVAVVDNLKHTTALEMDLRLEAAAISEMAANIGADEGFRVPNVDWRRTSKRSNGSTERRYPIARHWLRRVSIRRRSASEFSDRFCATRCATAFFTPICIRAICSSTTPEPSSP